MKLVLEAWLCIGWKSIKMVRLSVEQRVGAIGLVQGVTSFTHVNAIRKSQVNFAVFISFSNTTIWYFSSSSLKGNHFVIK